MPRSSSPLSLDEQYEILRERSEREDLVMFINACFAATRQNEHYSDAYTQSVSIEFLHQYILANCRRIYGRVLAAGINHFNQALIVFNLLAAGAPQDLRHRREEGQLIAAALKALPVNRVLALFQQLAKRGVNNRRTRAVVKRYLQQRREPQFDAVKYRNKYRTAAAHAHLRLPDEFGDFLFRLKSRNEFSTPLFEDFRQARYSAERLYQLPFTVAQGMAEKHGVPRDVFFNKMVQHGKMTAAEKLRYQTAAQRGKRGTSIEIDLATAPLTKLALYVLSLARRERADRCGELHEALTMAARRSLRRTPLKLGRVAAVLDGSRSMWGSREKRQRPLAVALACSYFLREAATEYRPFWSCGVSPEQSDGPQEWNLIARGQTDLGGPLLDALEWQPNLIVIVSDGYENDPPGAAGELARVYRRRIDPDVRTEILHVNPVFDAEHFSPQRLGETIPTVGIREADDLPTMMRFARFANGTAPLADLESYLAERAAAVLDSE